MQTNFQVRKIAAVHQTHCASTLQSIASKAHAIDARIEHLKVQGEKAKDALRNVPDDTTSRLAWLNQQLNG
jgi:hypothetical protein